MLRTQSVTVGRSYVNERERLIREVVEEVDSLRVKYNEFDLPGGRLLPAPFQVCLKSQLARWADREARALELARLHPMESGSRPTELPENQAAKSKVELSRANMEQVVGNNTLHRW